MKLLFHKILKTVGANFISLSVGLITLIITSRILGPEGRGMYAAILTWVTFFSTMSNLSLGQYASFKSANVEGDFWLKTTFSNLVFMMIITTVMSWIIAFCINHFDPLFFNIENDLLLCIGFSFLPFMIWGQYSSRLLLAINKVEIVNKAKIYGAVSGLIVLLVVLLVFDLRVKGALLALFVSNMIIAVYGIKTIYREARGLIKVDFNELGQMIKKGLQMHISTIGILLYNTVGILLVNRFLDNENTGYYQMSVRLFEIMLVIPNAIAMVMFSNMGNEGIQKSWKNFQKMLKYIVFVGGAVSVIGYFGSKILIPIVLGSDFEPSIGVFHILLITFIPISIKISVDPYWIGFGKFWQLSVVSVIYGLISVVLSYFLIPKYGMYGAAWATVIASLFYLFVTIGFVIYMRKNSLK